MYIITFNIRANQAATSSIGIVYAITDYLVYGDDLPKNDYISDYSDMYKQIIKYYNIETVEESEEQKAKKIAITFSK